ncbi:unnamed protein product [Brassica rapa subsp. trilocularis]
MESEQKRNYLNEFFNSKVEPHCLLQQIESIKRRDFSPQSPIFLFFFIALIVITQILHSLFVQILEGPQLKER